ncbi:MAG: radical SAM protein [Candidatus Omnitrophota bacterium]
MDRDLTAMPSSYPELLVATKNGKIYNVPFLQAAGMKAGKYFPLLPSDLTKIPKDDCLFHLPQRIPVGIDSQSKTFVTASKLPGFRKDIFYPVAAFTWPGYTCTYNSAYEEKKPAGKLPFFSYAAAAYYKGNFYFAATKVDQKRQHDIRFMDIQRIRNNIKKFKEMYGENRLIKHLSHCALNFGCPGAKNFFLQRYEAPLPASPFCNASCRGCISAGRKETSLQNRIKFVPEAKELAQIALIHIKKNSDAVVSFGQGCEGEPLLAADTIRKAILMIREETDKGIINMNTNASSPKALRDLFEAGLDSIRVTIASVREKYYLNYHRPRGYRFKDVIDSILLAERFNKFTSLNYLVMPGFTDSISEYKALRLFLRKHPINMMQWRNMNYDPLRYFTDLGLLNHRRNKFIGIQNLIIKIKGEFPHLLGGYFNPSRRKILLTHNSASKKGIS